MRPTVKGTPEEKKEKRREREKASAARFRNKRKQAEIELRRVAATHRIILDHVRGLVERTNSYRMLEGARQGIQGTLKFIEASIVGTSTVTDFHSPAGPSHQDVPYSAVPLTSKWVCSSLS